MSKVKKFLEVAGVTGTPEDIQLYKHLLAEEGSEFLKAWADGNRVEMIDGACDFTFIYESLCIFGHDFDHIDSISLEFDNLCNLSHKNLDKAFQIVCDSNLSKFDKTVEECNITAGHYFSKHSIELEQTYNEEHGLYVTKSSCDQTDRHGKFFPKGKLLKSATNYFEPDFSEVLK